MARVYVYFQKREMITEDSGENFFKKRIQVEQLNPLTFLRTTKSFSSVARLLASCSYLPSKHRKTLPRVLASEPRTLS